MRIFVVVCFFFFLLYIFFIKSNAVLISMWFLGINKRSVSLGTLMQGLLFCTGDLVSLLDSILTMFHVSGTERRTWRH